MVQRVWERTSVPGAPWLRRDLESGKLSQSLECRGCLDINRSLDDFLPKFCLDDHISYWSTVIVHITHTDTQTHKGTHACMHVCVSLLNTWCVQYMWMLCSSLTVRTVLPNPFFEPYLFQYWKLVIHQANTFKRFPWPGEMSKGCRTLECQWLVCVADLLTSGDTGRGVGIWGCNRI